MRVSLLIFWAFALLQTNFYGQVSTDNVFVLPIRKLKPGQDLEDFQTKRDAYVALLEAETGTITDREFQPFLSLQIPDCLSTVYL